MQQQRLQELFDELSGPLVLYARTWCDAPEDAVQEAFIDLANAVSEPVSPKAWLYIATRRKAQNISRAEGRRRRHHERATQVPGLSARWFESSTSTSDLAPDEVMQAMERLSHDERELVVARVWGDLGFEQLAELLGCSVSSAHRRYVAALAKLKTLMNESCKVHVVDRAGIVHSVVTNAAVAQPIGEVKHETTRRKQK